MKNRKLCLDIGIKSCGFALTDPLNITAHAKENFNFKKKDWNCLIAKIKMYLQEYEIDLIIIGYPTLPSGDKSKTTIMIENFKKMLEKNISCEIIFFNENMTTKKAYEIMRQNKINKKHWKNNKDKLAAQLILLDYLKYN